jgi:hypothetical protein
MRQPGIAMALAARSSAIYRKGMAIGHRLFAMTPSCTRLILLSMFFMNRHYLHFKVFKIVPVKGI